MSPTVLDFYKKENNPEYWKKYDHEHSSRLDFIFDRYNFKDIKNKNLLDAGGGYGYFLNKFDNSNFKYILEGANLDFNKTPKNITYGTCDLNKGWTSFYPRVFDIGFCFEVCEHLSDVYTFLVFLKRDIIENGEIYISIPESSCEHNFLYPGLFVPDTNFERFLGQMSLKIVNKVYSKHSFSSVIYKTINRPWNEKVMMFPKNDEKYKNVGPLELVNL